MSIFNPKTNAIGVPAKKKLPSVSDDLIRNVAAGLQRERNPAAVPAERLPLVDMEALERIKNGVQVASEYRHRMMPSIIYTDNGCVNYDCWKALIAFYWNKMDIYMNSLDSKPDSEIVIAKVCRLEAVLFELMPPVPNIHWHDYQRWQQVQLDKIKNCHTDMCPRRVRAQVANYIAERYTEEDRQLMVMTIQSMPFCSLQLAPARSGDDKKDRENGIVTGLF